MRHKQSDMTSNPLSIMLSKWWFRSPFFCILTLIFSSIIGTITSFDLFISAFPALLISSIITEMLRRGSKWFAFGLKFDLWILKEIIFGLILVIFSMIFVLFIAISMGGNYFPVMNLPSYDWFILTTIIIFIYSTVEELFFRGILFQSLLDRFGDILTTFIFSAVFALLHFTNRTYDSILILNLFLANILLSSMYIATRSLWLPISFHFFWNWSQAVFLGLSITGNPYDIQIFQLDNISSKLLFGGNTGIEGGIITTILLLLMIPLVLKFSHVSPYIASVLFRRRYEESLY
jgi:membrane protease YdiL (CAAX protease family)